MDKKGKYIVIEGLDGCGKTTQYQRILEYFGPRAVGVREPGGTPIAEAMRELLKDASLPRSAHTNMFLLSAARSDLIDTVVRPTTQRGLIVISDRSWLSTAAYQVAEGASLEDIKAMSRLAVHEFFHPDLVLLLDAEPSVCRQRLGQRGNTKTDYFDAKDEQYFKKVRQAYLSLAKQLPYMTIIDATPGAPHVWQQVKTVLQSQIS